MLSLKTINEEFRDILRYFPEGVMIARVYKDKKKMKE